MTRVAVVSAFRNAAHYVPTYLRRVAALAKTLRRDEMEVRVVAGEGDSTDGTVKALKHHGFCQGLWVEVVDVSHGGPVFGSTEAPERMAKLSTVANRMLDAVRPIDDMVVYVESDLVWEPTVIRELLLRSMPDCVVSPLIMAGEAFYDIWGFRLLDGRRFAPFAPFAPGLNGQPYEVGSVGSCLVMPAEVARRVRIRDDNALVGWCADARSQGVRIFVHPDLRVYQA